jgi:tetratricopeptide (TPR) repeat protein
MRNEIVRSVIFMIEWIVVILSLGSAWPFASVSPIFEGLLLGGVALLLTAWAVRLVVEGRFSWVPCPVAFFLAILCLLTILQTLPLPIEWVRVLSPNALYVRDQLTPSVAEFGLLNALSDKVTLSLDSTATRYDLQRLIAILAMFTVIRNNLRDPATFFRFGWLLAGNGVMLALVGIGQIASSPQNVVYWTIPTGGAVFGPFVNRNHAAYYLNLCIGLAVGLLLGTRYFLASDRSNWRGVFRDPRVLWLVCGIAIMLVGLLSTLSRGGAIGLFVGSIGCLGLLFYRFGRSSPWAGTALIAAFVASLIFWQGAERIGSRWESLRTNQASPQARVDIWRRTLPLVVQYPILGSGMGTFPLLEPMCTQPADQIDAPAGFARNDFLQLCIEGGILQLLAALAILGIVFRRTLQTFYWRGNTGLGRLALGALIGFSAIVVHSFVDYGLHIPAVAVLATVVAAMLMNLSETPESAFDEPTSAATRSWQPPGLFLVQALGLLCVSWFLIRSAWNDQQAERFRLASLQAPLDRKIDYLKSAIAHDPGRVGLYADLADCYFTRYWNTVGVKSLTAAVSEIGNLAGGTFLDAVGVAWANEQAPTPKSDLVAANAILLRGCQRSPMNSAVHVKLEILSSMGIDSEFRADRLKRLMLLVPYNHETWYRAGVFADSQGNKEQAFVNFRNCLLASKLLLPNIVRAIPTSMSVDDFLERVVPEDPKIILDAAELYAAHEDDKNGLAKFYRKALNTIDKPGASVSDEHWLLKGRSYAALGDDDQARLAYATALSRSPLNAPWRFEYGRFLYRIGDYPEARKELNTVRSEMPHNSEAERLYQQAVKNVAGNVEKLPKRPAAPVDNGLNANRRGSTVCIANRTRGVEANGVIIDRVGGVVYLLTAAHLFGPDDRLEVMVFPPNAEDGRFVAVKEVKVEATTDKLKQDLAILRISVDPRFIGEPIKLAPLQSVPMPEFKAFSVASTPETGAFDRPELVLESAQIGKGNDSFRFWKTKAIPEPGRSGGPLLDSSGRLIGICSGSDGKAGLYSHLEEIQALLRQNAFRHLIQ